jgi:site-specific recombinase XerD
MSKRNRCYSSFLSVTTPFLDLFVRKCIFEDMKKTRSTTDQDLRNFAAWLKGQGLAASTADTYVHDVRGAIIAGEGFAARLLDPKLAPKTRHRLRAVGKKWAKWREDETLERELKAIKLPAARRASPKMPLSREDLFKVIDEIDRADYLEPAERAVLGMLACRGLRVGDALRIQRVELIAAIAARALVFEGKGSKRLDFPLLKTFARHIEALALVDGNWQRVEDLIAPKTEPEKRRQTASKAIRRALAEVATQCEIVNLHPHRLRRTYAVEFLRACKNDPEAALKLREHMQWADVSTAMQYVDHVRGGELNEVAERIFER